MSAVAVVKPGSDALWRSAPLKCVACNREITAEHQGFYWRGGLYHSEPCDKPMRRVGEAT